MKKSGILLIFLSGCLIQLLGQETLHFHPDPALFIQEARDYFGERNPEATRILLSKLETAQKDGKLEENHWIDLSGKANFLEKMGGQPLPDFYQLIDAFLEVTNPAVNRSFYLEWSGHLDKLLQKTRKNLNQVKAFLDFTVSLARNGTLFYSSAFQWNVRPGLNACGTDSSFYVTIPPSDLTAKGSGDSTVIFSTGGRFYPDTNIFYGEGGSVTWQRLNIPAGQVYVKLGRYKIDLQKMSYTIDSVNLIDHRYFQDQLIGRIENKIVAGVSPLTAGYPRFTAYELRNRIKNLYPGMDYEGGFSLQGLKVLGVGLPSQKSVLTIFNKEKPLFRLASSYFSFQSGQALGINTEASIYLGADSIYHPGLLFQFNEKQKEISLVRDGQGLSPSRFLNTYHGYDLNAELIRWQIGDTAMTLTGLPGSIENRASFESSDFFNVDRFNEIMIADTRHPVAVVKQCADYYHSGTYTLEDLSLFMNKAQSEVEKMLLRLSFFGFVRYNSETRIVDVQERAYDFLKKNAGDQDYDVIRFESAHEPPEPNAILSLTDNHLKVFWVRKIEISQSRNVILFPKDGMVEILNDRDILFDGEVQGGLIRFIGKQFRFNYDDFTIQLEKVGELRMQVFEKTRTKDEKPLLADVTSVIEYTRGILRIDEPTDKSGLKVEDYPEYPVLQTDTNAYVYYDQKEILNGVYPRQTFNFNISPFILKGLTLMSFSDSLVFPGLFVTADIFPPIELALRHQTDHSLGFETFKTPKEGYPVYKGKGQFFDNIAMSKAGLKGSGRLEYLNSILISDDFLFLPDRVTTVAKLFSINKDTTDAGNPETQGQQMTINWYPGSDKLIAESREGPLNMYGKGKFDGALSLEPNSLSGKGTITFDGYSVTSDTIRFYKDSYEVVGGDLRIFRETPAEKADPDQADDVGSLLVAHRFNGLVDVKDQKARFEPAGTASNVVFSKNRYEAKPRAFSWNITDGKLNFEDAIFRMASKPGDSLNFKSGLADFDLKDLAIQAHSVDYIDVADVRVFPVDRNVIIRKYARIDSLRMATVASRDTALRHRITSATVSVADHKKYFAKGNYLYKDVAGREFFITFNDIQPDRNGISVGKGTIPVEKNFGLSPAFRFYGQVKWQNNERYIFFDGQTQLSHSCPNITLQWIKFSSPIYPDSVSIPIDSITLNEEKEKLYKGFFLSNEPIELYSTFIGPHLRYSDQPLISANGWLWYDEAKNQYKLASAQKKADPESDGPILIMDSKACVTEAKGPLTLGVDLGRVTVAGAGRLVNDLRQDSVKGSVMLTVDFFMDPKILDFMAKSINNASGLEAVNYGDPAFREAFKSLIGRAKGQELLEQISFTGKWKKIPDELMHTLVFTDIRFKWNPETGSYQSVGKLGISNIMGEPVNRKVNGYLEVIHRRGGDAMTMYIEIDRQSYFFLSYSRGVMQCVAGPGFEKFNTMIRNTKEAKRKLKARTEGDEYQYYIGTYQLVQDFLRRFSVVR